MSTAQRIKRLVWLIAYGGSLPYIVVDAYVVAINDLVDELETSK